MKRKHEEQEPELEKKINTEDAYPDREAILHFAATTGKHRLLDYLLLQGVDIETPCPRGDTPLLAALRCDQQECCVVLINRGADIEARTRTKKTPLIIASRRGNERICQILIDKGADVNAYDDQRDTSLIAASYNKRNGVCKLLIRNGADINAHNDNRWTALHYAIRDDNISLVKPLLSGARVDVICRGETPLSIAKKRNNKHVISLLENHIVTVNLSGVISRGLDDGFKFSDFLVKGIYDPRLFLFVAQFAFN